MKGLLFGLLLSLSETSCYRGVEATKVLFIVALVLGLSFGVVETVFEYPITVERIIPTVNHGFWLLILGGGIYRYTMKKVEWFKLVVVYSVVVVAHMAWNFGVQLGDPRTLDLLFDNWDRWF